MPSAGFETAIQAAEDLRLRPRGHQVQNTELQGTLMTLKFFLMAKLVWGVDPGLRPFKGVLQTYFSDQINYEHNEQEN
jgi:hypothetical protein